MRWTGSAIATGDDMAAPRVACAATLRVSQASPVSTNAMPGDLHCHAITSRWMVERIAALHPMPETPVWIWPHRDPVAIAAASRMWLMHQARDKACYSVEFTAAG